MAFRDRVVEICEFDESLPLYSWQEDRDYTSQAARLGKTLYHPACRGVHLGMRSGRVSGLRFGYSQIANPVYLMGKGTMEARTAFRFMIKHLSSNTVRAFRRGMDVDYPGRLKGNLYALWDLLNGQCHPMKIEQMVTK
jgi:hypothetical protein